MRFLSFLIEQISDMQFSFFLFFGYIGVTLLSPVMHNLWIWRVSLFPPPPLSLSIVCIHVYIYLMKLIIFVTKLCGTKIHQNWPDMPFSWGKVPFSCYVHSCIYLVSLWHNICWCIQSLHPIFLFVIMCFKLLPLLSAKCSCTNKSFRGLEMQISTSQQDWRILAFRYESFCCKYFIE